MPTHSVEKDFWVCMALRDLFSLPGGEHFTFKGGTSLSKAWGLIDRFSEDIDITVAREAIGFGGDLGPERTTVKKEKKRRLEGIKNACRKLIVSNVQPALRSSFETSIQAGEPWSIATDDADPDLQTLLFAYPTDRGELTPSYVSRIVKLEFGACGDPWPVARREVTSIVAEEFPILFDAPACSVRALLPERTFWEKVMLLHEETFRPVEKVRKPRMARHYYDVWRLIESGVSAKAVVDEVLFEQVAAHRFEYFRQNWVKYETLRKGTIRIVPEPEQLEDWSRDYSAMQSEMFVGTPPAFDEILTVIASFQEEFNTA